MTEKEKFGENLTDAVSSIDGQLDQLIKELEEMEASSQADRAKSIKNALKEIAPSAD